MNRRSSKSESPTFVLKKKRPTPSLIYDVFWLFAAKRQAIFYRRLRTSFPPWTDDPILRDYKFTNVYRASDRVSQYLIRNVIYQGDPSPRETLFRILLFKLFNKIETWEHLQQSMGLLSANEFDFDRYDHALELARRQGKSIYSGAYIMASGNTFGEKFKHQNHLRLIESMLINGLHDQVATSSSMESVYQLLLSYPSIGPFLAFQFAIDINYSTLTNFSEMDFVVAGPGAKDGIGKCFSDLGDFSKEDLIRMMADHQDQEFERLGIEFQGLWSRPMQLIDCQNVFCEVDKYCRMAFPHVISKSNRKRIKQRFSPTTLVPTDYFFPPKWGLNVE